MSEEPGRYLESWQDGDQWCVRVPGSGRTMCGSDRQGVEALAQQIAESNATADAALGPYADGVARLVALARHTTAGGRAAAQVLLSTYNGYEWHLDATDLCHLAGDDLEAAVAVLRGRAVTMREPQVLIDDGERVFSALATQWRALRVDLRYGDL